MEKNWMIISWKHEDHLDNGYGKLVGHYFGTYEDAAEEARTYIPEYSPVGVVGEIVGGIA